MKVLYIEDIPLNAKVMGAYMKHLWNIDIEVAEDAETGLSSMNDEKYDLILMDINLPGINGIEATRLIRKSYSYDQLPIVMVSANSGKETIKLSEAAGANGYLVKPVGIEVLQSTVGPYLE